MKKIIAWFSTLALLCSMLAGCSGETENSSPVPETLTAESVIQAFQEADIPIPYYIIYTEENDPNGDDTPYTEKGNFTDERIEITYDKNEPLGGSIEIFETPEEAEERAESLQRHIVSDPFLYQIVWKNALLRLNTAFTKEQVAEYATVFDGKMVALPVDYLHENAYCYGQPFIIHAKQLKSGMTIEEAEEIMGFDAKISGTTFFWADENSSNTVSGTLEDGKLKQVNFVELSDSEDSEESENSEKTDDENDEDNKDDEENGNTEEDDVKSETSKKPETTPKPTAKPTAKPTTAPTKKPDSGITNGQKNALDRAKSYLRYSAFSREGLIGQLEFEDFSHQDAVYAVDHCGANWNEQARCRASSRLIPAVSPKKLRFSNPVSCPYIRAVSVITPDRAWTFSGSFAGLYPKTEHSPDVGESNPLKSLTAVVFPAPFGPRKPHTPPSGTCSVRPFSAWVFP